MNLIIIGQSTSIKLLFEFSRNHNKKQRQFHVMFLVCFCNVFVASLRVRIMSKSSYLYFDMFLLRLTFPFVHHRSDLPATSPQDRASAVLLMIHS